MCSIEYKITIHSNILMKDLKPDTKTAVKSNALEGNDLNEIKL